MGSCGDSVRQYSAGGRGSFLGGVRQQLPGPLQAGEQWLFHAAHQRPPLWSRHCLRIRWHTGRRTVAHAGDRRQREGLPCPFASTKPQKNRVGVVG